MAPTPAFDFGGAAGRCHGRGCLGHFRDCDPVEKPCEQVREWVCREDPNSLNCRLYQDVAKDSVTNTVPKMRSAIKKQCLKKLERLQEAAAEGRE